MYKKHFNEICVVDDCNSVRSNGYSMCVKHKTRMHRYGSPSAVKKMPPNLPNIDRIKFHGWDEVNDCWIWKGPMAKRGYGCVRAENGKIEKAHRVSYLAFIGEIPEGKLVLHSCDNRSCIRPEHLHIGTQSDNMKEMWERGRRNMNIDSFGNVVDSE